jgi:hypothetical protein
VCVCVCVCVNLAHDVTVEISHQHTHTLTHAYVHVLAHVHALALSQLYARACSLSHTHPVSLSHRCTLAHSQSHLLFDVGRTQVEYGPTRMTPLHMAASWHRHELVSALLSHGADPSRQDVNGLTPLHCAVVYVITCAYSVCCTCTVLLCTVCEPKLPFYSLSLADDHQTQCLFIMGDPLLSAHLFYSLLYRGRIRADFTLLTQWNHTFSLLRLRENEISKKNGFFFST